MSTLGLLEFIRENSLSDYEELLSVAKRAGLDVPKHFGEESSQTPSSGETASAKIEVAVAALEKAVAGYDSLEAQIRQRLTTRDRTRLWLNIATTLSAGGLLTMIGADKSLPPWNYLLAALTLAGSIAAVFVDHLGIKTKSFWEELGEAAALREKADSLILKAELTINPTDEQADELVAEAVAKVEALKVAARELDIALLNRD